MTESIGNQPFQLHSSFGSIIDLYDGFVLDQFGVLHNGDHGLEGASECVTELVRRRKKLIILSNSSSDAASAKAKLPQLGFNPEDFVTSGQESSHYIAKEFGKSGDGTKALFLTWKGSGVSSSSSKFLEVCGNIQVTDNVKEASFIIVHGVDVLRGTTVDGMPTETSLGSFGDTASFDVIDPLLQKFLERKLPLICANPDFVSVRKDGSLRHMPGKISQRYQAMGGVCWNFGKPHVSHFEACLRELNISDRSRVVHVGDSLHHDIAGANATGMDSVFVVGGVHREELGKELGVLPEPWELEALFAKHSQAPTHVVPVFRI
jgi:HAD superfamily hydrolase (TIGR01450 family)